MLLSGFLLWLGVFELQMVINHSPKKLQFVAYVQFVLVII